MLQSSASVIARFVSDVQYGLRLLRKTPGFTSITILTLAIGIGANTALFSIADRVVLRPLPYPDSERLLILWSKPPGGGIMPVSPANFLDIKTQNHVFAQLAALNMAQFNTSIDGVAERMAGFRATGNFFDMLGVRPALGRGFGKDEDRPGAEKVAVLSYGAWQARFAGDPHILGRALKIEGEKYTVIGVMPDGFRFAMSPEVWIPLTIDAANAPRDVPMLLPLGRLRPNVSLGEARAEIEGVVRNLAASYPQLKGWGIDVQTFHDYLAQYGRNDVLLLFGAVGLVLLIACLNVANLLMARSAARRRELAVRASLGAGRLRIFTQLLTEGLVLAGLGGGAGVILSLWLSGLASSLLPAFLLDAIPEIAIDWRVLLFTLGLSVLTGLLFSALPAWRASRVDIQKTLKDASCASAVGGASSRVRTVLVVCQLAVSMVLLAGAGLLARTLATMYAVDPGFEPGNILTMHVAFPPERLQSPAQVRSYQRLLLERLRVHEGVEAATLTSHLPMQSMALNVPFQIASRSNQAVERQQGTVQYMSEGYFAAFRTRLRKGRVFDERDQETAPRVAVINESFVKRYLPHEEPVGTRLVLDERWIGAPAGGPPQPWEIVGVIADVKLGDLASVAMPQIYVPLMQCSLPAGIVAIRTRRNPVQLAPDLRDLIHNVDKAVAITDVSTMEQIAAASVSRPRVQSLTMGAFAVVGLILAALGIYGVMSYTVAQRTREMGIQLALGARPADLTKTVIRQGVIVAGVGLTIGLAGSLAFTRVIANRLYVVTATDPATYIAVCLLMFAVAMTATYIPARRAARVDPVVALRQE